MVVIIAVEHVGGRLVHNAFGRSNSSATVKSIDPDAFMDQAASDHVLALRVLHAGSVIMTHAVGLGLEVPNLLLLHGDSLT